MTFEDGGSSLGTGSLIGSTATFTTSSLSLTGSPHFITAVYGGDSNFYGNTSVAFRQRVHQPGTTATIVWVNPAGGFWDDPNNWDTGVVPGPTDDVLIDVPGDVTITYRSGATTINSLTFEQCLCSIRRDAHCDSDGAGK